LKVRIAGIIGNRFGLLFCAQAEDALSEADTESSDDIAPIHIRVLHPPTQNPATGKTSDHDEWDAPANLGIIRFTGWRFDAPWEIVPGTWTTMDDRDPSTGHGHGAEGSHRRGTIRRTRHPIKRDVFRESRLCPCFLRRGITFHPAGELTTSREGWPGLTLLFSTLYSLRPPFKRLRAHSDDQNEVGDQHRLQCDGRSVGMRCRRSAACIHVRSLFPRLTPWAT
jgi:hypothetical protein